MAGGRRSGRERKVLACPGPRGAAEALVRELGSQPREPESATRALPAVRAPRNLRRVIPAPSLPLLDRSPKFALSSLASTEGEWAPGPLPLHTSGSHEDLQSRATYAPSRSFGGLERPRNERTPTADRPVKRDLPRKVADLQDEIPMTPAARLRPADRQPEEAC
jgi:hypothetical protein